MSKVETIRNPRRCKRQEHRCTLTARIVGTTGITRTALVAVLVTRPTLSNHRYFKLLDGLKARRIILQSTIENADGSRELRLAFPDAEQWEQTREYVSYRDIGELQYAMSTRVCGAIGNMAKKPIKPIPVCRMCKMPFGKLQLGTGDLTGGEQVCDCGAPFIGTRRYPQPPAPQLQIVNR